MHLPRAALPGALILAFVAGCAGPGATSRPPSTAGPPGVVGESGLAISAAARLEPSPGDARRAAEAINLVGLDLLRAGTDGGQNAVLSPASIVLALAMARAGARGDTATELDAVMRGVGSDENATWLAALDLLLADRSGTFSDASGRETTVALRIVNAPFAQADYGWQQPYLDALAARFGAGVRLVDYVGDAEAARATINDWVDEQTEHRIPGLLPQGAVDTLTRMVLVNAVYLKAAWRVQFVEAATEPGPFQLLDGGSVNVPMMRGSVGVKLAQGDGWLAVDLPYVGEQLSMLLVMPRDLPAFEAGLDGPGLAAIVGALEDQRVDLRMPRFGIETKVDLVETLGALGMPTAFDPRRADFTGMTTQERLFISGVIHQANIDVDETGTEASAATGVAIGATSMPRSVAIDRAFLFALRDRETGAILFLGRVVEPVER